MMWGMTSNRYGVIGASVSENTQGMWNQFRARAKARGLSYTRALEQAARLWLDQPDPVAPPKENPFR